MVTVICVLALEHAVSRAYERRLTRQLTRRAHNHGEEAGGASSDSNSLADMDEKELAQRDAHIRSFAIAQVGPFSQILTPKCACHAVGAREELEEQLAAHLRLMQGRCMDVSRRSWQHS